MDPDLQESQAISANEALVAGVAARARNLYLTRQMLCAEAVVVSLNQAFHGGLSDTQAMALAAPFCAALGESGCICGALSGAVMATGLLLGREGADRHRGAMREGARRLHDTFKGVNGATCCRVLCDSVKHDPQAHFRQCAELTAGAAESAARLVIEQRPDLAHGANRLSLDRRQSIVGGMLLRIVHRFTR